MSEYDYHFREFLSNEASLEGSLRKFLWELAIENKMLPSEMISIWNDWISSEPFGKVN